MADTSPILCRLFDMQDTKYRDFQSKLIPNVSDELFIGIRTPNLRKYAKELYKAERDPSTGRIRQGSVLESFLCSPISESGSAPVRPTPSASPSAC